MHKDNYKNVTVITLPVGQLKTNCYLLIDKKTRETIIIDPGDDSEFIMGILKDNNCDVKKIIATHGHFDHVLAVTDLQLVLGLSFIATKEDEFLIKNSQSSSQHFLGIKTGPNPIINKYLNEKELKLGKIKIKIISTPGHTPGSVCLYLEEEKIIFVGDLIFAHGVVGRTDLSYSDKNKLIDSVLRIRKLPGETMVYPGHGESFILEEFERKDALE